MMIYLEFNKEHFAINSYKFRHGVIEKHIHSCPHRGEFMVVNSTFAEMREPTGTVWSRITSLTFVAHIIIDLDTMTYIKSRGLLDAAGCKVSEVDQKIILFNILKANVYNGS